MDWSEGQRSCYLFSRIFYPPIADCIHKSYRKKHYGAIQDQLYESFDADFWEERRNKTLRISQSTSDSQLAYIDFLNFNKRKSDYVGPALPMTLLLAGSGTFNNPYYLNFEDDPLAKSLVYLHKDSMKKKLPIFFENLNTLLTKTSFFKSNR